MDQFKTDEVEEATDAYAKADQISTQVIGQYDALVCDVSSSHGGAMFSAGIAEALGKPVIYIVSEESRLPAILRKRFHLTYSANSISRDFLDELRGQIELAMDSPKAFLQKPTQKQTPKAFISYCHKDRHYLDRLLVHLKPLTKAGAIDAWADTRIKAGERWKDALQRALDSSSIAILMISADFLASDFIIDNELPPLLSKSQVSGTRIVPLIVSPSRFARDKNLNIYQAANSPNEPLSLMSDDAREAVYDKLAQEIEAAISST
jgi:hypothetical protein